MDSYSSIGLCVFCCMVGLAAGPSFIRAAIVAMAAGGLVVGRLLGVETAYTAGARKRL